MTNLLEVLKTGKKLIADGALGTFLFQKGLQPGTCPEQWNIDHPEEVMDIAKQYLKAGSDIITTNSFGANYIKLKNYGLEKRVREINLAATRIIKNIIDKNHFVAGSIGPTGKLLIMGDVTEEEVYEAYKEQSIALQEGGIDAILIETMSDIQESILAIKAAKENTSCVIICTMAFEKSLQGGYFTMMGVSPAQMMDQLIPAGVDIIGANCGSGSAMMIEIAKEIRAVDKDIPLLIQANAGMPVYKDGITSYPETPEMMAENIKELIKSGVNIIGGCCGTTPAHIREIAQLIKIT